MNVAILFGRMTGITMPGVCFERTEHICGDDREC